MNLNPGSLHIASSIGPASKVAKVDLNLIPSIIQTQRHGAVEGPDASTALKVAGAEPPPKVFIIQDLHLEGKVALEILDHEDKEWKSDSKTGVRANRTVDVGGAHVVPDDFKGHRTNAGIRNTLDVAVHHFGAPDAQRLVPNGVENGEEASLVGISEHFLT